MSAHAKQRPDVLPASATLPVGLKEMKEVAPSLRAIARWCAISELQVVRPRAGGSQGAHSTNLLEMI
jgi:hypothetical protein